jgi:hypothetical protein
VVAEGEIRREPLAQRSRVGFDPRVELGACAVLQQLDLVAVVAVDDEDRQEAADVRPHDLCAADVVPLGMRLLAEDGDLVPSARPLARELLRVHVRPGAGEQVAVPEQDAHERILAYVRWK